MRRPGWNGKFGMSLSLLSGFRQTPPVWNEAGLAGASFVIGVVLFPSRASLRL